MESNSTIFIQENILTLNMYGCHGCHECSNYQEPNAVSLSFVF